MGKSGSLANQEKMIGKWQLIEVYGSDGANGQWSTVSDGYFFQFNENMSIDSDHFVCSGIYTLNNQNINLLFDCSAEYYSASFEFSFENNNLIFWDGINCDEGCGYKFEKINL